MQPLKSYNRMQMQLASSAAFPEPLLAAMPQLREKPRLGFSSKNPALYQGHGVCNSTTALGLQAALHLERIRSRYTGKERDTESGNDYFGAVLQQRHGPVYVPRLEREKGTCTVREVG